jgi:serine/threonine-protein kinase
MVAVAENVSTSLGSEIFGVYRTRSVLGRGGMGTVYAAEHVGNGAQVALKVINGSLANDATANERFLREARVVAKLAHPNIVRFLDMGVAFGRPFIVMELLEGETLDAFVQRQARLTLAQALDLFLPLTSAVFAIHGAGVVHRDLKLANIFLARRPMGRIEPVVLDFGISRLEDASLEDASLTRSAGILGTPRYLSPEQVRNVKHASALSDQYAIGVMLYESVSGQRPFSGTSPYELMHAILTQKIAPPSAHAADLPAAFDALVARAMHREASARFPDVRALGSALLALAGGSSWSNHAREFLELGHLAEERTESDCRPIDATLLARFSAVQSRPIETSEQGDSANFTQASDVQLPKPTQASSRKRRRMRAFGAVCVTVVAAVSSWLVLGENKSVSTPAARSSTEPSVVSVVTPLGARPPLPEKLDAPPPPPPETTPTRAARSLPETQATTRAQRSGSPLRRPLASTPVRAKVAATQRGFQTPTLATQAQTRSGSDPGEDDAIDPFAPISH